MTGPSVNKTVPKTVQCKRCGQKTELLLPGSSVSLVCSSCRRVIDVNNENKSLSIHFRKMYKAKPLIPLGVFCEFNKRKFKVVGFLARRTDDQYKWTWKEYLLFNPYYGYRWLVEDHGHWSFVKPVTDFPKEVGRDRVRYFGKSYSIYSRAPTAIIAAEGEFYWRIKKGEKAWTSDYVNPPEMLSRETSSNQVFWSLVRYLNPQDVQRAFKETELELPVPEGIGPHQPYAFKKDFKRQTYVALFSILLLFLFQWTRAFDGPSAKAFFKHTEWNPTTSGTYVVTDPFTIEGDLGTVGIYLSSNVENNWLLVNGALVNIETGRPYSFKAASQHYFGDNRRNRRVFLTGVPKGTYDLNFSLKSSEKTKPFFYSVSVIRNPKETWGDFWVAFVAIFFVWLGLAASQQIYHYRRWKNSDYSPYGGGG